MSKIVCYVPTFCPDLEASIRAPRPYNRLTQEQIRARWSRHYRHRPSLYLDCIDSIMNTRPDIRLIVADGRSTDSIRAGIKKHREVNNDYELLEFSQKMSQWRIFNYIIDNFTTPETEYFVYSGSDVCWYGNDWVGEAIKEFEKDPALQIIFPCVSRGDPNLPMQITPEPVDVDLIEPPWQDAAIARVLNSYAMIFRMEFLRFYGGYPAAYSNCYTESFLDYMCEAMGGKMRLMPRGWVHHFSAVDAWTGEGGYYNYNAEKGKFLEMMTTLQRTRADGKMTVDFLKNLLQCEKR